MRRQFRLAFHHLSRESVGITSTAQAPAPTVETAMDFGFENYDIAENNPVGTQ